MKERSRRLTRRALLLGASAAAGALVGRTFSSSSDPGPLFPPPDADAAGTVLNDASELSPTPVASHVSIADSPASSVERLRSALAEARSAGRPLIASTARHSMGGQSLARLGTVVTLDQEWLEADTARNVYRVAAGTRWSVVMTGRPASSIQA